MDANGEGRICVQSAVGFRRYRVVWSFILLLIFGSSLCILFGVMWGQKGVLGAGVMVAVCVLFVMVLACCSQGPGQWIDVARPVLFSLTIPEGLIVSRPNPFGCEGKPKVYPLQRVLGIRVSCQTEYYRHLGGNSGGVIVSRDKPFFVRRVTQVEPLMPDGCPSIGMCCGCQEVATCAFLTAIVATGNNIDDVAYHRVSRKVWNIANVPELFATVDKCTEVLEQDSALSEGLHANAYNEQHLHTPTVIIHTRSAGSSTMGNLNDLPALSTTSQSTHSTGPPGTISPSTSAREHEGTTTAASTSTASPTTSTSTIN